MKKQLFFGVILAAMLVLPNTLFAQSTEGTDFWVTLMRGDDGNYDALLLSFSANHATKVYIENKETEYRDTVEVGDNDIQQLNLNAHESSCYVTDAQEETPVYRALHVTSDKPISLIAANYKNKSFDVASILPTRALLSEYRIQCYDPYSHSGTAQGSHFAIVAADDNVIVDIVLTAGTDKGEQAGDTITTDVLKRGQVYYVWTGNGEGSTKDFTGTEVKARDNKKIAVFNGNSHTNIPSKEDRDHIYSQAMPINYWGRRFAITSSLTTIDNQKEKTSADYKKLDGYWERIDKVRVLALVDGTIVKVDGDSVYTFDFATNPKRYFEFDFGAKDNMTNYSGDGHKYFEGASHYIETSCPSAVHLFMTSNRYDHGEKTVDGTKYKFCNGDPSLIWINPIEQKIKELTFGTFETKQVTDHFINIITTADNVKSVLLDGDSIYQKFDTLTYNKDYMFARLTGVINGTHTLTADSGFIAHVYGFGQRESYGYPAGGNTRDLSATLYINDEPYSSEGDNLLCGDKSVLFECRLDYKPDSIYWYFGDGTDTLLINVDSIRHFYDVGDRGNVNFEAYVKIFREIGSHDDDDCYEWTNYDFDSIHFHVNVGMPTIEVKRIEIPRCIPLGTATDIQIVLDNPAKVDLTSDSVQITLEQKAILAGFKDEDIQIQGDSMIIVHVPADTPDRTPYNMHIHIGSQCESTVFDKDIEFHMEYAIKQLEQRYNNVLGLIASKYVGKTLSDFVWIHNAVDTLQNQQSSVLYLDENDPQTSGDYFVCYTVKEAGKEEFRECTCPVTFDPNGKGHSFDPDVDNLTVSGSVAIKGNTAFVNADWQGKTDIECYAQWISVSGATSERYDLPDGGRAIPTPTENGFYILRVVTDGSGRSFKIYINH